MGKAGRVNMHILEPSPRYIINEYDSMEDAIKNMIMLHDMEIGKDITKTLKIASGPYPDMGFDHTKLLIIDDVVVGSIYEYQDDNDVRPCNRRSADDRENYILYRSFNIFTGMLGKNRHRFESFDKMLDYFKTNNNFKKDEIAFGELDKDIKIDGWYMNRAWGVYHIAADKSISILGYAVIFGDLAKLGNFTEINANTTKEKSSANKEQQLFAAKKDDSQTKKEDIKPQSPKTNGIRKCMVTDIRTGMVRCAYFHGWVKMTDSPNYDTMALIEFADGREQGACTLWTPHHIRFIDV